MAKKPEASTPSTGADVVEELHVAAEGEVEYEDVTGKDDLPEGVEDVSAEPAVKEPVKKSAAKSASKDEGDDIPEDLKGKTPAQLAKMYKDAQSLIGRQGAELGDLRRTADTYIKANLAAAAKAVTPAKPAVKAPDAVDFFTNPEASIARAIAEHPALKELQGANQQAVVREQARARQNAEAAFQKAHPDATDVLADESFRAWILKSPVRQAMLLRAHKQYDLAAANEVFDTWKELKAAKTPPADPAAVKKPVSKPVALAAAARVPTGGNMTPAKGGVGADKIYRRADVIRLMEMDPDRYALMAEELTKAYETGRVR